MDFDEAAAAVANALVRGIEFEDVTIQPDGSVAAPPQHDASVAPEHRAGAERIAAGIRILASQLRPADELVTVSRAELLGWFEGRDGLEAATPRCNQCLVQLELHSTAEAWVCPSCDAVTLM